MCSKRDLGADRRNLTEPAREAESSGPVVSGPCGEGRAVTGPEKGSGGAGRGSSLTSPWEERVTSICLGGAWERDGEEMGSRFQAGSGGRTGESVLPGIDREEGQQPREHRNVRQVPSNCREGHVETQLCGP